MALTAPEQQRCAFLIPMFVDDARANYGFAQEVNSLGNVEAFIPFASDLYFPSFEKIPTLERQVGEPAIVAYVTPRSGLVVASFAEATAALAEEAFDQDPFFDMDVAYLLKDARRYEKAAGRASQSLTLFWDHAAWLKAEVSVGKRRIALRRKEARELERAAKAPRPTMPGGPRKALDDKGTWAERIEEMLQRLHASKVSTEQVGIVTSLAKLRAPESLRAETLFQIATGAFDAPVRNCAVDQLANRLKGRIRWTALLDVSVNDTPHRGDYSPNAKAFAAVEAYLSRRRSDVIRDFRVMIGVPSSPREFSAFFAHNPILYKIFKSVINDSFNLSISNGELEVFYSVLIQSDRYSRGFSASASPTTFEELLWEEVLYNWARLKKDSSGKAVITIAVAMALHLGADLITTAKLVDAMIASNSPIDERTERFFTERAIFGNNLAPKLISWMIRDADIKTVRHLLGTIGRYPSGQEKFISALQGARAKWEILENSEIPLKILSDLSFLLNGDARNLAQRLQALLK